MKKLHAERLLQVVRVLEELPKGKRFDLTIYHRCGIVACALGWAAADPWFMRRGYRLIKWGGPWQGYQSYKPIYKKRTGFASATDFFGVTGNQATQLFSPAQYQHAKSSRRDVIRRIKAFVKANT